jgi:hypothetical protein
MYRVELFIEVPASLDAPGSWEWNTLINSNEDDTHTPVHFVLCSEVIQGRA